MSYPPNQDSKNTFERKTADGKKLPLTATGNARDLSLSRPVVFQPRLKEDGVNGAKNCIHESKKCGVGSNWWIKSSMCIEDEFVHLEDCGVRNEAGCRRRRGSWTS